MTWREYLSETVRAACILAFGAGLSILVVLAFTHPDGRPLPPTTVEVSR